MDEQSEPSPAFPEKLPEVLHSSNDDALEETSIMSERISEEVSTSEEKAGLSSIPGSSAAETLQALTDKALRFLSEASNETIGACLVGLGAATYIVLGRVGLILIGVVGGVVLHATWDPESAGTADAAAKEKEAKRKRELGLAVANRLLQWRDEKSYDSKEEQDKNFNSQLYAGQKLDYSGFASDVAAALDTFTDAVIRDYVKWWYSPVLPGEESFPSACRRTLTAFVLSMSNHLSRKRPVDAFLDFITNSSSIVIVFLNELSAALSASPGAAASDAIVTYLHLKPDSNLAHVLDSKHQDRKLDMVAEDILQNYLDPKAYNCAPVHVFLKEVLSKLILAMTIASCSKPEWINGWIVYLLEEVDPELLNVVDASVESSTIDDRNGTEKQINEEEPANVNRSPKEARPEHRRQVSRAEEAMDEAMKEAQRLTQMIAEEDARRERERQSALSSSENVSEITTQGIFTPTSSQSDMDRAEDSDSRSVRDSMAGSGVLEKPQSRPATPPVKKPFTSFDQILPDQGATALQSNPEKSRRETAPVLTLHNAKISIFDDSMPGEKAIIKVKPTIDYLIQIEPASSTFPGWMIARKFADFETLHEVLRRISAITGVGFNEAHPALPSWKQNTKASLRNELERYLMDAVRYQQLAESEGMKRFLEKDQGLQRSPTSNKGFGWPTPSAFNDMGKGMMDVLTKAPKEVAGGGKAFFGGVTSVLGGVKKPLAGSTAPARASHTPSPSVVSLSESYMGNANIGAGRSSQESTRSIPASVRQTPTRQSVDYQNAFGADNTQEMKPRPSVSRSSTLDRTEARGNISKPPTVASRDSSPVRGVQEKFQLPPPPSEISDDYGTPARSSTRSSLDSSRPFATTQNKRFTASTSADANDPVPPPMPPRPQATAPSYPSTPPAPSKPSNSGGAHATITTKAKPPLTSQETQVAIELLFAVITELYTLSSAWTLRRTLLNAAKTFLLRPGNPQLEAIRLLIQESVIDANTSPPGLAALIYKVRENALPTTEEMEKWRREGYVGDGTGVGRDSREEKEELRKRARRLLVERGMPQALTGVMGQAASGEALGKVFDCLQVESVARGLVFGLVLQGLRTVVQ